MKVALAKPSAIGRLTDDIGVCRRTVLDLTGVSTGGCPIIFRHPLTRSGAMTALLSTDPKLKQDREPLAGGDESTRNIGALISPGGG